MSPYRRPGWQIANGHIVRSQMEACLCEYLDAQAVAHDHGSLVFEVEIAPDRHATFVPDVVLTGIRKDGKLIIVEPVASARPGGGARRLAGFVREYGDIYYLIVIAKRVLRPHIPEEAYHAFVALEDFSELDALLAASGASG